MLRNILKIRYPFIIKNDEMYERTKEEKWSDIIKQRRLRWTGHLHRLPENYPAWKAYEESQRITSHQKKCKGNKLTWKNK